MLKTLKFTKEDNPWFLSKIADFDFSFLFEQNSSFKGLRICLT